MKSDIHNMLTVCELLDTLKVDMHFDQVSILREYQEEVWEAPPPAKCALRSRKLCKAMCVEDTVVCD